MNWLLFQSSVVLLILFAAPLHAERICPTVYKCWYDECTIEEQKEYAESLLEQIEYLDNAIPSPSPRELDWLEKERAAGGERSIEASLSVENKKKSARSAIDSLSYVLSGLITALDDPRKNNRKYRTYEWVRVAGWLADSGWVEDVDELRQQGVGGLKKTERDSAALDVSICSRHASVILGIVERELREMWTED